MDQRDIRWGIIGPGRIADTFTGQLQQAPGNVVTAVGSRNRDRADGFAARHGIRRAYGSYQQVFEEPEVDVVYLATPHAQHHALALAAIQAGKHVLVEKAFTCRLDSTIDLIDHARAAGVFVMEAMKTRFLPGSAFIEQTIAAGTIGEVRAVRADLGFPKVFDARDRLWDAAQGGGAMLDLGVYPVAFALQFLGAPDTVAATGELASNGVDAQVALQLGYRDGRYAQLACSLTTEMSKTATILGTRGAIHVAPPFHHLARITVTRGDQELAVEEFDASQSMLPEALEVAQCIRAGRRESAVMSLDHTLGVMRVMDDALEQLGATHWDRPVE